MKEWKVMYQVDGVNKSVVVEAYTITDAIYVATRNSPTVMSNDIIAVQLVTEYAKQMEANGK